MTANIVTDPIAYVEERLAGRRLTHTARKVARVVAERLVLRCGEWITVGVRKREIADLVGVARATVQEATRALASGPDPIFVFEQRMEHCPRFNGMVRAWSYRLIGAPSQTAMQIHQNRPADPADAGTCWSREPAASPS